MYAVIAFLSQTEKVHELVQKMKSEGFTGGTLFDAVGLKRAIPKAFDIHFNTDSGKVRTSQCFR